MLALEPGFGLVPNFGQDISLGVEGFDALAEFFPEARCFDFQGNIQPPAVDTLLDPELRYIEEEVARRRASG